MSLQEWIEDAEVFAEELLDPEDFQKLQESKMKTEALKEVATAGMKVYLSQVESVEAKHLTGMDELIAMETATDYSQEAMRAALGRQMDKIIPGFLKQHR